MDRERFKNLMLYLEAIQGGKNMSDKWVLILNGKSLEMEGIKPNSMVSASQVGQTRRFLETVKLTPNTIEEFLVRA